MKIIITAGGTGGHIFPAISVAQALQRTDPTVKLLFIGARGKMEMHRVPDAGYEIAGLPISGFNRKISLSLFALPFKLMASVVLAMVHIIRFRADAVIGFGGYASGPTLIAALLLGRKRFIHEQNSFAGLTNRRMARFVNTVFTAYENAARFFPSRKVIQTGNPVRAEMLDMPSRTSCAEFFQLDAQHKTLLALGGSLGARTINEAMLRHIQAFIDNDFQIVWQTGANFQRESVPGYVLNHSRVRIFPFIREMPMAYGLAHYIISRAGALTIAELCVVGKPCILIPSPNVTDDHQTWNARSLSDTGAAVLLTDKQASDNLLKEVMAIDADSNRQSAMSMKLKSLATPHASDEIARHVIQIMHRH